MNKLLHYNNPFDFDMALQLGPVFYMMEKGIRVNLDERRRLSGRYHGEWGDLQAKLDMVVGESLNVNSPKQVKAWLYETLSLPPRHKKGKLSANEDNLRSLLALCQSEYHKRKTDRGRERWLQGFVSIMLILKIRAVRKRISSYIDVPIDSDGRMRSTLSVGGTETARFSSSKTLWDTGCNLQTIPRELRKLFIADDGMEIAEFDLNRGESWVYSHLAGDPDMIAIHAEHRDFHAETACAISELFGETIYISEWEDFYNANPDKGYKLRFLGKKSNHAFAYRMGPYRAAEVVNEEADDTGITITGGEAKKMRELWLEKYCMIPGWWSSIEIQLSQNQRILETPWGRRRQFYGHWGDHLFKEATAYVPQSTSVDYLNCGMLEVYNAFVRPKKWGIELLHQNHDSILIQYYIEQRHNVLPAVRDMLQREIVVNDYKFTIPVEAQYGPSWGTLTEWADAKAA